MSLDDLRMKVIREFIAPFLKIERAQHLHGLVVNEVENAFQRVCSMAPPVDIRSEIAYPVPAGVVSTLIGIPRELHPKVRGLAYVAGNIENHEVAAKAGAELNNIISDIMDDGGVSGEDSIIRRINQALSEGRYSEFTREQFVGTLKGIQIAGQMNAATAIERGMILLLSEGMDISRISADSEYLDGLVEEILRCPHPVFRRNSGVPRYVKEDMQVGDTAVGKGDLIILDFEEANADPSQFDCPEKFDPSRWPNAHLTFGYGPHFCLGAMLARMEIRTVLQYFSTRIPDLRLSEQQFSRCTDQLSGGVNRLFVEW
ncbi:cytochrome P450 [Nocardia sp. NPDC004604]|uniref:cytochrome P450 n=1 Tax=Nocardia sp. NPDC004604 TaxID=3157013 RepID=UPI0033AB2BB7